MTVPRTTAELTARSASAVLSAVARFGAGLGWRVWAHLTVIVVVVFVTR